MERPKVTITLGVRAYLQLEEWLLRHEIDIGSEINDFGDLEMIYLQIMGKYPRSAHDLKMIDKSIDQEGEKE